MSYSEKERILKLIKQEVVPATDRMILQIMTCK